MITLIVYIKNLRMACNCMTQQQLNELYKQFGYKTETPKNATIAFKVKNFFIKLGLTLTMVLVYPMLFLYLFYRAKFGNKRISLKEFFDLKEDNIEDYYARQQQKSESKGKRK